MGRRQGWPKSLSGERFAFSTMLLSGRAEELQVTPEQKAAARHNTTEYRRGHIGTGVWGEKEGRRQENAVTLLKVSCFPPTPFEKSGSVQLKQAPSLSHELLNRCLFFFITSVASDSNYLANKDRVLIIKTSPLRKRKLHSTHSSHLSCNSIISFISCFFQASPNKPLHLGQIPRGEAY